MNLTYLDQARQVFYVADIKYDGNWKILQKISPRNIYDVLESVETNREEVISHEIYQQYKTNEVSKVEQIDRVH